MSLKQKALKGAFWSTIQQWTNKFLSLAVFTILARLLEPESFGLIALAGTFLRFVNLFLDQGFSTAIVQRKDLEPEHLDTAFWTNISLASLMALITVFFASSIAQLFREPDLTSILRWLSLTFVIGSFNSVQTALFQKKLDFRILAIRSSISTMVGAFIGVIMAFMGFGVWSLVAQQLSGVLTRTIILWTATDWLPQWRFSVKHFLDLFSFGVNILGINFLNFLITNVDNLLIGYYLDSTALGYYDLGFRLLVVISQLFIGVISSVGVPIFSKVQDDLPKLRNVLYKLVKVGNIMAFPIFITMSFLAPEIIIVVFGEQWVDAIPVMRVLSLIGIFFGGFSLNQPLLISIGKPDYKLKLDVFRATVQIIAFFLTVQSGIVAVATGKLLSICLTVPVVIFVMKKVVHINLKTYGEQYFAPFISSIIMLLTMWGVRFFVSSFIFRPVLSLPIYLIIASLSYIIVIYLLDKNIYNEVIGIVRSPKKQKANSETPTN